MRGKIEVVMWDAIHKETGKECFATEVWKLYKNPHKEDWLCCPICKKSVTPVKGHVREKDSRKIFVTSHFRIKDKNTGGCIYGESDEHKKLKILIATLIENQSIKLKIGDAYIPYSKLKIKSVPELPYRWEQTVGNRRADVKFQFKEWHPVLGQGIVFEIALTETEQKKIEKEIDWNTQGYSLAWLEEKDFEGNSLTNSFIKISNPWSLTCLKFIRGEKEEIKDLIFEKRILLDEEKKYGAQKRNTCRTCKHGGLTKIKYGNPELITCWYGRNNGWKKRSNGVHEPCFGCDHWEQTNKTIKPADIKKEMEKIDQLSPGIIQYEIMKTERELEEEERDSGDLNDWL